MPTKKLSPSLKEAAAENAQAAKEAIVKKVRTAMRLIDEEIAANDGVYPGGKINQREVCRRAGIHWQTLQQPSHKDSTRLEVSSWIEAKANKTLQDTRKAVTNRAEHWKEQHQKVTTQIAIYEAEFGEKNSRIAELEADVAKLQEQVAQLQKATVTKLATVRKKN